MRLDKFISTTTTLSRAEAKKIIKNGILINNILVKSPDYKVDEILTNDGELAHKLISPKKDVEKKYYVEVSGKLKDEYIKIVENGLIIDGGYKCKSARLEILESIEEKSRANIFITEGKFHQVKRMMKALGTTVTYLKRLSIGSLKLDENLKLGEYRYLTEKELKNLNK